MLQYFEIEYQQYMADHDRFFTSFAANWKKVGHFSSVLETVHLEM